MGEREGWSSNASQSFLTRVYFAPPMLGCPGSWGFSNDQPKPVPAVLACVAELGEMVNKTLCQLLVSAME